MSESKIKTAIGMCVVDLTKFLMEKFSISQEDAYKKLVATELYSLILIPETNLFLEQNDYLFESLEVEFEKGKDAMVEFITAE